MTDQSINQSNQSKHNIVPCRDRIRGLRVFSRIWQLGSVELRPSGRRSGWVVTL